MRPASPRASDPAPPRASHPAPPLSSGPAPPHLRDARPTRAARPCTDVNKTLANNADEIAAIPDDTDVAELELNGKAKKELRARISRFQVPRMPP